MFVCKLKRQQRPRGLRHVGTSLQASPFPPSPLPPSLHAASLLRSSRIISAVTWRLVKAVLWGLAEGLYEPPVTPRNSLSHIRSDGRLLCLCPAPVPLAPSLPSRLSFLPSSSSLILSLTHSSPSLLSLLHSLLSLVFPCFIPPLYSPLMCSCFPYLSLPLPSSIISPFLPCL